MTTRMPRVRCAPPRLVPRTLVRRLVLDARSRRIDHAVARVVVQQWLYNVDQTTLLGIARIGMGYPLTAVALAITVWAVARAGHRQRDLQKAAEEPAESDEAVEARLRAKYGEPATER